MGRVGLDAIGQFYNNVLVLFTLFDLSRHFSHPSLFISSVNNKRQCGLPLFEF